MSVYRRVGKRLLDLALAGTALVLLFPVIVATAGFVWLSMGRPVLFRHDRPGRAGRPFVLLKFRTMNEERDASGALLPDASRLTRAGRWLRTVSLDELPQLWNVVRGDMSLVGPRPLLMEYLDRYTAEQKRRHAIRPGITGWAQVHGRNTVNWEAKFAYDLWYVNHHSLGLDLKIILMTVWKALRREGISQAGTATAEKFTGSKD